MLKVITLKGCSQCAKLKSKLGKFIEFECDSHDDLCDLLELISNSCTYPMAIVNNSELYYIAESYEDLKLINTKKDGYILKPQASLEQMIEKLKK